MESGIHVSHHTYPLSYLLAYILGLLLPIMAVKDMRDEKKRETRKIRDSMKLLGTKPEYRHIRAKKEWQDLKEAVNSESVPNEVGADYFLKTSPEEGDTTEEDVNVSLDTSFINDSGPEGEMVEYLRQVNRQIDLSSVQFPKVHIG